MSFSDQYELGGELGKGAFAVVKDGTHKESGDLFAIKIISKNKLTPQDEEGLKDEIKALQLLKHQYIMRLFDVFDEGQEYFLVTEKLAGGELFDRIVEKTQYTEKEARDVGKVLFEALQYCHSQKVAHRDLKPENLLLLSKDNDSEVKLGDFGFAKVCPDGHRLKTPCGTPSYVAPEILKGRTYNTQVDMWSIGVIMYILLCGYQPFVDDDQQLLFKKIRNGAFEYHDRYWSSVSDEAKDLVSGLLTPSPKTRITATQALEHQWIMGDDDKLAKNDLGGTVVQLKKFNARRRLKGLIRAVMITRKLNSLGDSFAAVADTNND
mmetsp:Transcript_25924/g.29658  ORF Transcript_25924/g.29658 Transcript_25924/m.29658 type:complete len:322 (+) Transcript_25924:32-997(+)|eukprot:CAMPEP_0194145624 /NCGR_PEP_ID=MMETSP0152-20130528/17877_1 /TAXON_ID=1049557 /ORGANISM="Thalassiothrix antarctica, Strain L6-D1" /LENGTH=321 /DNA_ID=CAMNT_0038845905 /DNA_START=84 /DNA_END=1052 /DNA_ORIENTATION=-